MTEILVHVFAPLPLVAVLAGAGLIACAQTGFATARAAFTALHPLITARPDAERDTARAMLFRIEAVAELHGLMRTDRLEAEHPFIAQALITFANARDVAHFARWMHQAISDRRSRHTRVITFWNAVADAAPAIGMAGTIIGLIGMFAGMHDPSTIGASMALALMTTLHGMILANVIAGPIANRLAGLSEREIAWQQALAERMIAIGEREGGAIRKPSARPNAREAA
jgi:chemotaxis protein MotA